MIFTKKNNIFSILSFITILSFEESAFAVQQPDAGQALQNLNSAQPAPKESSNLFFTAPKKTVKEIGGVKVKVSAISIKGNSIFSEEELIAAIGETKNKDFNMSDLQEMADKITTFYYKNDYPFARAFITKQAITKGVLKIEVVEGRYGEVKIEGEASRRSLAAGKFLKNLEQNKVIGGKELERAILLLNDQPGYKFIPVLRAGKAAGTGDLSLDMKEVKHYGGSVKIDNYGNRYMGKERATASFYINNPFTFGDQISLTSLYSTENLWYGMASYNLPLGSSGLRANIGYSNINYELGKQFKSLGQYGDVKILSAGLSYPIIRSQKTNLYVAPSYQHKWLSDSQTLFGTTNKKNSDVLPLNFNFDTRDSLLGNNAAVTYGMIGWTYGVLDLGNNLKEIDKATAKTNGSFNKFNFDLNRIQALPKKNLTLFARLAGQKSLQNLDSSERFSLGGPNGVRAYPTGENYGDEGYLAQFEMRYAYKALTPYIFYDQGHIKTNRTPWSTGSNQRTIAGAGTGLRYNYQNWNADATIAWRTVGNSYLSDNKAKSPMIWLSLGYKF